MPLRLRLRQNKQNKETIIKQMKKEDVTILFFVSHLPGHVVFAAAVVGFGLPRYVFSAAVVRQPYNPTRGRHQFRRGCRAVPLGQPHNISISVAITRRRHFYCGCRGTTALQTCAGTTPTSGLVGLSHWGNRIM